MKESTETKKTSDTQSNEQLLGVMKLMQQQLTFLERKIDTLVEASQKNSREPRYSKPFRSGGAYRGRGGSGEGNFSGERSFRRNSGGGSFDRSDRGPNRGPNRGNGGGNFDGPPSRGPKRESNFAGASGGGFNRGKKKPFRPKKDRY